MNWLIYVLGGWFWFLLVTQIVIIIITIVIATSKGYSGILAFLLGLFIPLLGSLIIIALLPNQNIRYSHSHNGNSSHNTSCDSSPIKISTVVEQKTCTICGQKVNEDRFICPRCGNESFK
jgi:predicted RNA-binding Zn-ribbon protein involved in translation (DUF1610 family)